MVLPPKLMVGEGDQAVDNGIAPQIYGGRNHINFASFFNSQQKKYSQLVADFEFVPVAVETSGIIGSAGCSLLTFIGRRISWATNDPRQMSYIFQQISVAIIRDSALAMTASSRRYARSCLRDTDIQTGDIWNWSVITYLIKNRIS